MARTRERGTVEALVGWLRRQSEEAGDLATKAVVELVYGGSDVVSRWKGLRLGSSLAQDVSDAAQDHADEAGSVCSYTVRYRVPSEASSSVAGTAGPTEARPYDTQGTTSIRRLPRSPELVEAPTTEGQLTQQMRFAEKAVQTALSGAQAMMEAAAAMLSSAASQVADRDAEIRELRDELRGREERHVVDAKVERSAAERILDVLGPAVAKELGPDVASKIRGMLGADTESSS